MRGRAARASTGSVQSHSNINGAMIRARAARAAGPTHNSATAASRPVARAIHDLNSDANSAMRVGPPDGQLTMPTEAGSSQ